MSGFLAAASWCAADITPRWVENSIDANAIWNAPALSNARSFRLVVDLSGDSRFARAGLYIPNDSLPDVTCYHHSFGPYGQNALPNTALIVAFPALRFDTYVSGADGGLTLVTGRYHGTGLAMIGFPWPPFFAPEIPKLDVNIAWGGTSVSGALGGRSLEIARFTLLGELIDGQTPVLGEVRASDAPDTPIAIPPLPVAVPEPAGVGLAMVGYLALCRRRRGTAKVAKLAEAETATTPP